jgi:hypothetical protein
VAQVSSELKGDLLQKVALPENNLKALYSEREIKMQNHQPAVASIITHSAPRAAAAAATKNAHIALCNEQCAGSGHHSFDYAA